MADDATTQDQGGSQENYFLAIDTPLGDGAVVLLTVRGEDEISRPFLYRARVASTLEEEKLESLLGKPVTLWLVNNDPDQRRPIHGYVRQVAGAGVLPRGASLYDLEIVPRLWFLSCSVDCRIFQHQSVPDIIKTLFDEHGIKDVDFRFEKTSYAARHYVVQFQESALDFVCRLMEHVGLFFWHEHEAKRHLLVIADRNNSTGKVTPYQVKVMPNSGWGELLRLDMVACFRPGKWTLNDYDFESPTKQLLVNTLTVADVPRMPDHEIYEYPGHFTDPDEGRSLTRLRVEMEEAHYRRAHGEGGCTRFDPGRRFVLSTEGAKDKGFLLLEVRHDAHWEGPEAANNGGATYENSFVALPVDVPFRPERRIPRPFIRGTQTATVVGPAGELIYCDEYGRVKVQFHWDRRGQRNENSSCWLRVAQGRSGGHYGSLMIPHVGHEVLVSFIEGDPDRPLITGTVPNADRMPAVVLPDDKHKTVQRDHGNNRMVMHGADGAQYFALLSPRHFYQFTVSTAAQALSASGSAPAALKLPPLDHNPNSTAYGAIQAALTTAYSTDKGQAVPGQDNAAGNAYTVTEKDADEYVGGDANTFVKGIGNSWYGQVVTVVLGTAQTTVYQANTGDYYNSNTTNVYAGNNTTNVTGGGDNITNVTGGNNTTDVNGGNNTTQVVGGSNYTYVIGGGNITAVLGDNSSLVEGTNNALYLGLNATVNVVLTTTVNIGPSSTVNAGPSVTLNIGPSTTFNDFVADTTGARIDTLEAEMKTTASRLTSAELDLLICELLMVT